MKVIAAPGLNVPMEDKPTSYINDQEAVEVSDDSIYYARRIAEGDLILATETKVTAKKEGK